MAVFQDSVDYIAYPNSFDDCNKIYNNFILNEKCLPMTKEDIALTSGIHI